MDCRRTWCVIAVFLAGVAGCDMKSFPLWPSSPPGLAAKTPDGMPPRPEELEEAPKELKPATLVAMGAVKEQRAAETTDAQEKESCRAAAFQTYHKALEKDPKYIPAHAALARWHESAGNHDKAVATYREAIQTVSQPGSFDSFVRLFELPGSQTNKRPAAPERTLWYELGMCHARAKEWDAAIDSLRKAVELDPDDRQYAKTLGLCLARAGRIEEGLAVLEKKVGKAEAHCTVARMLYQMKQDAASKQHVQIALQLDANLPAARELLDELEGRTSITALGNPPAPGK